MNKNPFQRYKIEIELLSPLFIGSGKEWYPNEYYRDLKNDRIFIIDFEKLFKICQEKKIDFTEAIKNEELKSAIKPSQGKKTQGLDINKFIDRYNLPLQKISKREISLKWDYKKGFKESVPSNSSISGSKIPKVKFSHLFSFKILLVVPKNFFFSPLSSSMSLFPIFVRKINFFAIIKFFQKLIFPT